MIRPLKVGKSDKPCDKFCPLLGQPPRVNGLVVFALYRLVLFECREEGLDWYHGEVKSVVNEKSRVVKIEWDADCLAVGDANCTKHKLFKQKWNPAKPGNDA